MDAHFGWARQGTSSEQPGLGQNFGRDVLGIPGTNGTRQFESGWPTFEFEQGDDFATIGVNENFMPYYRHDPQEQYVVNFNWIKGKHDVRFGGDIYHQALNQTQAEFITGGFGAQGGFGFDRGITERCETVSPETGNCEETSSGSRYNSVAGFLIGQASRAGRTLQVPDEYHVNARLYSTYVRDRWTPGDKLSIDVGTRFEYFPVPTRPDRGIEFYDVDTGKVLLCGVGSIPKDCGIDIGGARFGPRLGLAYRFSDKWVARAGYGLTNDPYYGMELIRANYPILNQLKLESPDGLTPAATLVSGITGGAGPGGRRRRPGHPKRLCVAGLPQETRSGIHPVLELHRAAGAAVGLHGTGGLRRHSHHAAARTPRHQRRPGHWRWRGRQASPHEVWPNRVDRAAAADRRWQVRLAAVAVAAPLSATASALA